MTYRQTHIMSLKFIHIFTQAHSETGIKIYKNIDAYTEIHSDLQFFQRINKQSDIH